MKARKLIEALEKLTGKKVILEDKSDSLLGRYGVNTHTILNLFDESNITSGEVIKGKYNKGENQVELFMGTDEGADGKVIIMPLEQAIKDGYDIDESLNTHPQIIFAAVIIFHNEDDADVLEEVVYDVLNKKILYKNSM